MSTDAALSALWLPDHSKHPGQEAEVLNCVLILRAAQHVLLKDAERAAAPLL